MIKQKLMKTLAVPTFLDGVWTAERLLLTTGKLYT